MKIIQFLAVFLIFSLLIFGQNQLSVQTSEEESDIDSQTSLQRDPELTEEYASSKVDPLIAKWQSSSNPEEFAQKNNLSFSDDKIVVYVYLDSEESISKLPPHIEIRTSNENIVVVKVNSNQINELAQMDVVERITPPIYPRTLSDSTEEVDTQEYGTIIVIIIAAILIISIVLIFKIQKIMKRP